MYLGSFARVHVLSFVVESIRFVRDYVVKWGEQRSLRVESGNYRWYFDGRMVRRDLVGSWARGTCVGRDLGVVGNCVWTFGRASSVKEFGAIGAPVLPSEASLSELLVASSVGNPYSYGLIRSQRKRAEEQPGDHGVLVVVFRF